MKFRNLAAALAALASNPADVERAIAGAARSSSAAQVLAARDADGKALSAARRDELLQKLKTGEHVEIELDILAYEQKSGEFNRNFVRFRDGLMMKLGSSGKGKPFLRDHDQDDVRSIGGTIVASRTEKRGEGDYAIHMTVRLAAPWAVELALRDLLNSVSIGWHANERPTCSACNVPVFSKCYHWPGDRLKEVDAEGGGKRKIRDAAGTIVVEWIHTDAELVECSAVVVPAVPGAHIEGIRASLSATHPALARDLPPDKEDDMNPELLKLLGLAATATAEEVLAAVNALKADKAALAIVQSQLVGFKTEIDALAADRKKREEDAFIAAGLASGRIGKADEASFRALHQLDAKRAGELMAERKENSATPVGALPQRTGDPDPAAPPAPVTEVRELHIEGGGIPGFSLYERGTRSKVERKEIARQVAEAVKALEMHPNPQARRWAQCMGFEGRISVPTTLAATSIVNNQDLDAARTAFRAAFMQSLEMAAVSPMELLFTTVPTNTPLARIHWMGDLPGFEEWTGDRKLSGVEAFKLDLQSKKWSNGIRIKNDDVKFDNLGLMPQQIGGLATKGRRHRLDRMAGFMIDGFAGGTFSNGLAYDGSFFFADAHRGGNDNKLAVALDAAGLTSAELLLESMTTYDGNDALDVHGSHLIVGPKLRATAEKLLTQERLANGEDNYHRGKYKLIVDNRFRGAADDYWFLGDLTHDIKPFIYQLVEDISTSAIMGQENNNSMPSFMNDELFFGAQANYNMSYFEFRLLVGSVVA